MLNNQQMRQKWGLSQQARAILSQEPEILEDLKKIRKLPPLSPEFKPKSLEIRFDDVTYIRLEREKISYYHPCSEDFQPTFSEYKLDEETVLFHVDGEVVVDRTVNLNLQQILQSLKLDKGVNVNG